MTTTTFNQPTISQQLFDFAINSMPLKKLKEMAEMMGLMPKKITGKQNWIDVILGRTESINLNEQENRRRKAQRRAEQKANRKAEVEAQRLYEESRGVRIVFIEALQIDIEVRDDFLGIEIVTDLSYFTTEEIKLIMKEVYREENAQNDKDLEDWVRSQEEEEWEPVTDEEYERTVRDAQAAFNDVNDFLNDLLNDESCDELADAYCTLGFGNRSIENITLAEVKQAYKRLSREFHPDMPNGNHEAFVTLNKAYEIVKASFSSYSWAA